MNHSCSHNQDDLVFHFYGELDAAAGAEIEARLLVCASCQQAYHSVQLLEEFIPQAPSANIPDDALEAIRNATSRRLSSVGVPSSARYSLIPGFSRSSQWAMVFGMILIAFIAGRGTLQPAGYAGNPLEEIPSRVSGIDYNASDGLVQIQFERSTQGIVEGGIRDLRVQSLLGSALRDDENPAGRLSAARVVSESNFLDIRPDPGLISALQVVLETESNQGIRLQAIKALRSLFVAIPVSEDLKRQLFDVLLKDPNTAVRIEAMDLLTRSELVTLEMKSILESARTDLNPLIRRKAEVVLEKMETSGLLEDIQ